MKKIIVAAMAALLSASALAFSPQTGTWAITEEVDGTPGRGIALDVQNDIVIMQIYAYKPNGDSAFYLFTAPLRNDQASGPLHTYTGGRYFGSERRVGVEAPSPGDVSMRFINGTEGYIRFPGELEKHFSRLDFVYGQTPESLLGLWGLMSLGNEGALAGTAELTRIVPGTATGSGIAVDAGNSFICEHQIRGELAGTVLCVELRSGIARRTYLFSLSINDGEGVNYRTTSNGTQSGPLQDLIVKRLRTKANTWTGPIGKSSSETAPTMSDAEIASVFEQAIADAVASGLTPQ